jgi:hypothetical protein
MHKLTGVPEEVEEIVDGRIVEVAAVDRPATGLDWRYFKGISPTLSPGANHTACLATGDQPTPTLCEAGGSEPDTLGNLSSALAADMAGHDAKITSAKAVLEYVDAAIARGELGNKEGSMKQQKCPAPAGRKDEIDEELGSEAPPVPEDLGEEAPSDVQEAIEVPATPTALKLGDCINMAQDAGLDETLAGSACGMIRAEFADPDSEEDVLIPEGVDIGGLINLAAMQLTGKRLEALPAPPKGFKFTGRSVWTAKFKSFLGIKPRPAGAKLVDYLNGVERRLEEAMSDQVKSRQQLDQLLQQQGILVRALAAATGAELPDVSAPAPAATPAPAPEIPSANPLTGDVKSQKDGAAVGAPVVPAPEPDRLTLLEQQIAEMRALFEQQFGGGIYTQDPEDEDVEELVAASAASPSAPKRVSQPGATRLKIQSKGIAQAEAQRSSITGMPTSAAERDSARKAGGGLPRISYR